MSCPKEMVGSSPVWQVWQMQASCHCLWVQTRKYLWACSRLVQSAAPAVHSPRWPGWPPFVLWKGRTQLSHNFFKLQHRFIVNFSTFTHTTNTPFATEETPNNKANNTNVTYNMWHMWINSNIKWNNAGQLFGNPLLNTQIPSACHYLEKSAEFHYFGVCSRAEQKALGCQRQGPGCF